MSFLPRVAILGGAFNPVHKGHLSLASALWKRFSLARLLFVPTGIPPHKSLSGDPGAHHRLRMLKEAIGGCEGWETVPIEIERSGTSYTVSTLEEMDLPQRPWLIVGTDAFLDFLSWENPRGILNRADLLIASRPGTTFETIRPVVSGVFTLLGKSDPVFSLDESRALDQGILSLWIGSVRGIPFRLALVRVDTPDISSTMVRDVLSGSVEISEKKKEILPASVKSYIVEKELFGEG